MLRNDKYIRNITIRQHCASLVTLTTFCSLMCLIQPFGYQNAKAVMAWKWCYIELNHTKEWGILEWKKRILWYLMYHFIYAANVHIYSEYYLVRDVRPFTIEIYSCQKLLISWWTIRLCNWRVTKEHINGLCS